MIFRAWGWHDGGMARTEGFEHQRLSVVPQPLVDAALARPVTRRAVVTDAGYFPRAAGHARYRPSGSAEAIIIVCVAGSGWIEAGGASQRVGSSTAIVIPSGVPHAYGASETDPWTIWWCHVRGSDIAELVAGTGVAADGIHPARLTLSLRAIERVTVLLDEIETALARDSTPARLIATAGMAWRLLTQLAVDRALPEEGTPLERALRYLEDRVDGRVSVAELAAMVGMSASHLSALFRQATGGGVLAHHTSVKMARARALLDSTDQPIGEIARQVGMHDPLYFSRQFSRVHGISPTRYRAMRKG